MSITTVVPFRGATVQFASNFYDVEGVLTQPGGAVINIVYPDADGVEQNLQIPMVGPHGAETRWTALWDTRDVGPGVVFWSIHTTDALVPFAVDDGRITISANAANLPTF